MGSMKLDDLLEEKAKLELEIQKFINEKAREFYDLNTAGVAHINIDIRDVPVSFSEAFQDRTIVMNVEVALKYRGVYIR